MAETKDEIAADRDRLAEENERLRGEVIALQNADPGRSGARHTFPARAAFRGGVQLSEGERQDLITYGVISDPASGRQLLASDFDIEPRTEAGRQALARAQEARQGGHAPNVGVPGVTHVWPSVRPGVLAEDAPVRGAVVDTAVPGAGGDAATADSDSE